MFSITQNLLNITKKLSLMQQSADAIFFNK